MIEIIGVEGSAEYRAAKLVERAIKDLWPGIESSPPDKDHIKLAVSTKLSGYRVQDVDIVLCGRLVSGRQFRPRRVLRSSNGDRLNAMPVMVDSFVVAIEVKDQGEQGVRVTDDQVSVRYTRDGASNWKSATDQNVSQMHTLKSYFSDHGIEIFARRCMIFPSLANINAPSAVASSFDGHQLFSAIATTSAVSIFRGQARMSAGDSDRINRIFELPIFRQLRPSGLDRRRMDQIAAKSDAVMQIIANSGKKMVVLRGHGGTGKTVALLQAAWVAYQEQGKRSLFLTYNHALAADLRRLMALLGVPATPDDGGVSVETVMSFMYRWLARLQIIDGVDLKFADYPKHCDEAITMLAEGVLTPEDIRKVISQQPDYFDFDQIFVDEGQDWPIGETRLLKAFYDPHKLVVADGVDQLVRGGRANWFSDVQPESRHQISLTTCLRMKRNLAIFAAKIADHASLGWRLKPNPTAAGGRIIMLKKPYAESGVLHKELVQDLRQKGNAEIDMLFCVPPSGVIQKNSQRKSILSETLIGWGGSVWEGVDPTIRNDFPRALESFRIVQYASCRGLEGWVVVLDGFDEYLSDVAEQRTGEGLADEERLGLIDLPSLAWRMAYRNGLIALTRPIDTLVIQLRNPEVGFGKELLEIAMSMPDVVEVY